MKHISILSLLLFPGMLVAEPPGSPERITTTTAGEEKVIAELAAAGKYHPDGKFLNVAILTLPERYLADIPMEKRGLLLVGLSSSPFADRRLDYNNGYLHWKSDNGTAWSRLEATSTFYLKLLRGEDGRWLTFVHMTKPRRAPEAAPRENQTFVLKRGSGGWKDVTREVIPDEVNLAMHFRPHRSDNVIEVIPWERVEEEDGQRYYKKGTPKLTLVWQEGAFRVAKPK